MSLDTFFFGVGRNSALGRLVIMYCLGGEWELIVFILATAHQCLNIGFDFVE